MHGNPMESVARVATRWCKSRGTQGDMPGFDSSRGSWENVNAQGCTGTLKDTRKHSRNVLKTPSLPPIYKTIEDPKTYKDEDPSTRPLN